MHVVHKYMLHIAGVVFCSMLLPYTATAQTNETVMGAAGGPVTNIAPQIKLCSTNDVRGLWRLIRVIETPKAERSQDFKNAPHQFVLFNIKQSTFSEIKSKEPVNNRKLAIQGLNRAYAALPQQFVLDENGVLFIYKNRVFSHSYYCGISKNKAGIYRKGDMVLRPTAVEKSGVYELYRRPVTQRAKKATKPNNVKKKK